MSEHILLYGRHLELGFASHSYDAAHDGIVTYGENNTRARSLDHKCRRQGKIMCFKSIVSSAIDAAWDRFAAQKCVSRHMRKIIIITFLRLEESDQT